MTTIDIKKDGQWYRMRSERDCEKALSILEQLPNTNNFVFNGMYFQLTNYQQQALKLLGVELVYVPDEVMKIIHPTSQKYDGDTRR